MSTFATVLQLIISNNVSIVVRIVIYNVWLTRLNAFIGQGTVRYCCGLLSFVFHVERLQCHNYFTVFVEDSDLIQAGHPNPWVANLQSQSLHKGMVSDHPKSQVLCELHGSTCGKLVVDFDESLTIVTCGECATTNTL
jgi:hypothetical protein